MIELTMPYEDRAEVEMKGSGQNMIIEKKDCEESAYNVWCLPIEKCCRGLLFQSVWTMCKTLGLQPNNPININIV